MKDWSYGINSLHRTANVFLNEGPWYVFVLDWIAEFVCDHLPDITLPAIPMVTDEGEKTTWREYHGTWSSAWCLLVHNPIYAWKCSKVRTTDIPMSYETARELFYAADKGFFDEEEKIGSEAEES